MKPRRIALDECDSIEVLVGPMEIDFLRRPSGLKARL